ncbi:MAG: hypothetical protein RR234_04080, partial [Christensenella sp.]
MTSRERLMTVLRHGQPDRVPVSTYDMTGWHFDPRENLCSANDATAQITRDVFTTYLTGWWNNEPSYAPLMEEIRKKADCVYMTDVATVNRYTAENTVLTQNVCGNSTFTTITLKTPKGDLTQKFRTDKGIYTSWQTEHRIKDDSDIEKFLSIPFDPMPVDVSHIAAQDKFIGDNGIILVDIPDPICSAFDLFDFGEFTVRAFSEEKLMCRLLDKIYEEQEWFLKDMLKKGAGPLFRFAGPEVCTP